MSFSPASTLALGLGGNLGDVEGQLGQALDLLAHHLAERGFGPLSIAPLYRSAPISAISQPDFLNTVALAELESGSPSEGLARELLGFAKALEHSAGRREGERDSPRPLDVDLLFFGELQIDTPELTLPHPRFRGRRFVLAPLADLAPDLPLPPDGQIVRDALAELGEAGEDWVERA